MKSGGVSPDFICCDASCSWLDSAPSTVQDIGMSEAQKTPELLLAAWGLELTDWNRVVADLRIPAYRAKQIWCGLQEHVIRSWDELSSLPTDLRHALAEQFAVDVLTVVEINETRMASASS